MWNWEVKWGRKEKWSASPTNCVNVEMKISFFYKKQLIYLSNGIFLCRFSICETMSIRIKCRRSISLIYWSKNKQEEKLFLNIRQTHCNRLSNEWRFRWRYMTRPIDRYLCFTRFVRIKMWNRCVTFLTNFHRNCRRLLTNTRTFERRRFYANKRFTTTTTRCE